MKIRRIFKTLCVSLVLMILVVGCSEKDNKENSSNKQDGQGVSFAYSKASQEKYGLPESFTLDYQPERLIVMTLGPTEILHELGVNMIAVPDILDESAEWTKDLEAQRLPFTAKTVDTEGVIALNPDMIIMSVSKKEVYGNFFEEKGIPVYYTVSGSMDSGAIDQVKAEIELYGNGFGKIEALNKIMERFNELEANIAQFKIDNATIQGQKIMILLEAQFTYTNASGTTLGDMMSSLGYVNMADDIEGLESVMGTATLQISTEVIVEQNPPMIIAQPSGAGAGVNMSQANYKKLIETELNNNASVWSNIDAIKNNRILYLGTDVFPGTSGLGIFQSYAYLMEALPKMK